jgi:signal transduction histidine kinase
METRACHLRGHSTRYYSSEREVNAKVQPEMNGRAFTRETELDEQAQDKKGSWQWDLRTDVTSWSEPLYRIAGRDPETAVPSFKEHSSFYTSDSWDRLTAATVQLLQTGQPYELELQMRQPDGTRRHVIGSGEAVRDVRGDILRLCGTVEDVTESTWQLIRGEKESESQRDLTCEISGRLVQAHEEENTRIASDLRDNISQKLCLLAVEIQGFTTAFPELTPPAQVRLEELWRYTAEIVEETVQVSHHLYPSTLDLLGLPLAIQGFCREFSSRNQIPVEYSCTHVLPEKIGNEVALSFFRILQEALGNVAKDGHAGKVIVELIGDSWELLLCVSDDGVGVEPQRTKVTTGPGFIGMRERLRSIGGELAIWSTPTQRTRIEARAPLKASLQ